MKNLLFHNPVFRPGLNATVRNGLKWALGDDLIETVAIRTGEDGPIIAKAVIVGRMVCHRESVPAEILIFEHDPACRTTDGLAACLLDTYGNNLDPDGRATVLFFRLFEDGGVEVF